MTVYNQRLCVLGRMDVVSLLTICCLMLCLWTTVSGTDLCQLEDNGLVLNEAIYEESVYVNSVPRAGKNAGHFLKVPGISDWISCVAECCSSSECDLVFYVKNTCFHIVCNVTDPTGCQPVENTQLNSTLVVVRKTELASENLRTEAHMEPDVTSSARDLSNHLDGTVDGGTGSAESLKTCEIGLEQCSPEEECKPHVTLSRQGLCQCKDGHQRIKGVCQPMLNPTVRASPDSVTSLPVTNDPNQSKTTTSTPGPPPAKHLTVSAGGNKILQLPENSVTLSAFVLPKAEGAEEYHFVWSVITMPPDATKTATMEGTNTQTLKLSNLIAGLYQLKIQVTGDNKFGDDFVNVTVLPPQRQNTPPIAIIKPAAQEVKSQNTFILDGSDSKDDDAIATYHWEEVSGPLQEHNIDGSSPMLTLGNLAPGFYVFKLTVTDKDSASNSTTANVTVIKEIDYPPKADAGSDVVIHLPQKSVTLCGNASTDDKGIASYEWSQKSANSLTADMLGSRSVCLTLSNLDVGDYVFTLKVTDTGGNTGTADVHVFVKPETNHPPEAHTAGEITVMLPTDNIVLDGQNSTDDTGPLTYEWHQTGGPTTLTITNNKQALTVASGNIIVGEYQFTLTVTDGENQQSSQKLKVTVKMNENHPPVANAGGDRVVLLPIGLVTLDGTSSSDDHGIASYLWERDSQSLAAGDVLNRSDHQAVLQLVNLVAGRYTFSLTITDAQGLSSKDTASLVVKNGEEYKDLIELILDTDIRHFTQENKLNIANQLELLLHESPKYSATSIRIYSIQEEISTGNLQLSFFLNNKQGGVAPGVEVVEVLRGKLDSHSILSYRIVSLDTVLCQTDCSGHGQCDHRTKICHCEAFWMPNWFKFTAAYERNQNCEWSILYVVIICFLIIVCIIAGIWGTICCCRSKRCRLKTKKRHRYSLLHEIDDDDDKKQLELLPKGGKIQNSSVMMSESDFSSDEETLFINNKTSNGHLKPLNGVSKQHYKAKLKT